MGMTFGQGMLKEGRKDERERERKRKRNK